MRISALSSLALVLLLVPGPALAATSAGFGASNTHCYTYGPAEGITFPITGFVDLPVHECSLATSGAVRVLSCDTASCAVTATGTFRGTWNVPTYGLVGAGVVAYYDSEWHASAICTYIGGDPLNGALPSTGGSCSGTAAALPIPVRAGQCRPVGVNAAVQLYVVTANPPVLGYMALTYTWSRIDHEFSLCRNAAGTPDLQHVHTHVY